MRWQKYDVTLSAGEDTTVDSKSVEPEVSEEPLQMASVSGMSYGKRATSPASSAASTAGASYNITRSGMTQRKNYELGSSASSPSRDSAPRSHKGGYTAKDICGWTVACTMGVLCLIFLFVVYFVPTKGIFPVGVILNPKADAITDRTGRLQVYPGTSISDYEYVISLEESETYHNIRSISERFIKYPIHNVSELPPPPYEHCWFNNPQKDHPCFFDRGWFGSHCLQDGFGYNTTNTTMNPCFLIRLEDTGSWSPQPYKKELFDETLAKEYDASFLGLGCTPKEGDESGVTFERKPVKGFSVHFFPVTMFDPNKYILPAVMVQVKGVPRRKNVSIECWIWNHNSYMLNDRGNIQIHFFHKKMETFRPLVMSSRVPISRQTTTPPEELTELTPTKEALLSASTNSKLVQILDGPATTTDNLDTTTSESSEIIIN